MTKAEQAALKAYPTHKGACNEWVKQHLSGGDCAVFIRGYERAEQDFALTWEDVQKIHEIICGIDAELESLPYGLCYQEYWEEVLRRFGETKNK